MLIFAPTLHVKVHGYCSCCLGDKNYVRVSLYPELRIKHHEYTRMQFPFSFWGLSILRCAIMTTTSWTFQRTLIYDNTAASHTNPSLSACHDRDPLAYSTSGAYSISGAFSTSGARMAAPLVEHAQVSSSTSGACSASMLH